MRIGYLSNSTIGSRKANSIQVMQMCSAFAGDRHDVTLFSCLGAEVADDYGYYGVDNAFDIVKSPAMGTPRLREWMYARATMKEVRRREPFDLIYGRHLQSLALTTRNNIPFVYEAHQPASPMGRAIEYLLFRRKNLARVVFITEALRRHYLKRYPWLPIQKTQVAHDGATDTQGFEPATEKGRLKVGYSGSFYAGRGIDLIGTLARRMTEVEFHICGGSAEEIVAARRLMSDCENIHFHGHIPPSTTRTWQQSVDILLAPYQRTVPIIRWLSPLKIFEYMAAGRPIIISDMPVFREVLSNGDNALLVPADEPAAWERAIRSLAHRSERNVIAQRALDDFRANYTWKLRAHCVLRGILNVGRADAA